MTIDGIGVDWNLLVIDILALLAATFSVMALVVLARLTTLTRAIIDRLDRLLGRGWGEPPEGI